MQKPLYFCSLPDLVARTIFYSNKRSLEYKQVWQVRNMEGAEGLEIISDVDFPKQGFIS